MRMIIAALVALTVVQGIGAQVSPVQPRIPEITATGRGEVPITPDRATVMVSVESHASSAAAAAADNSARMARVLDALRRAGLAQSDITTAAYTVGQDPRTMRMAPSLSTAVGAPVEFLARNSVRANVKRSDDVGKIIDAALGAGATSISSVQFSSPTTEEARRQAISLAVAQAQKDADAMARAAGGSLGRLLTLSSSPIGSLSGYVPSDVYFSTAGEAAAYAYAPTMINPRDMTVSVSVFGRWEFVPGR